MFEESEIISSYSIEQATEDGVLFELRTVLKPEFRENCLISHATTNLMRTHGYLVENEDKEESMNIPNCIDLLNNSLNVIREKSGNFKKFDDFFAGEIETPNGEELTVWLELNELQKFTVLLPEDH